MIMDMVEDTLANLQQGYCRVKVQVDNWFSKITGVGEHERRTKRLWLQIWVCNRFAVRRARYLRSQRPPSQPSLRPASASRLRLAQRHLPPLVVFPSLYAPRF